MAAGSGCWRTWRPRTRSWWRWTRAGRGSVTITCSPTCCSWSCAAPSRTRSPGCTGPPPGGWPGTATRWRRSGTPRRRRTGGWPGLYLDGQAAVIHQLLGRFPAGQLVADAELAAVAAGDELARGSLEAAGRYLGLAERASASVPDGQRGQFQVLLGVVRLLLARQRGNSPAVAEEARRLQAVADAPEAGLGEELRALALINLGGTAVWTTRFEEAERYLEQGVTLARRIGRPFLEFSGLAYLTEVEIYRSFARAAERSRQVIELAERHGWTDEPCAGVACGNLADVLAWQGRPGEAEAWIQRAERTLRAEAEPAAGQAVHYVRGMLELAKGRDADALAAFQASDRLSERLAEPNLLVARTRAWLLLVLVRLGETERAEEALAALGDQDRDSAAMRIGLAVLRLAQDDPSAAVAA